MTARLLHLIDPGSSSWPALALLSDLLARPPRRVEHESVIIGGLRAEHAASAAGIRVSDRIAPTLSRPFLASRTFRRLLSSRRVPDAIVAWSVPSAVLAHQAAGHLPVVTVLTLPPPPFIGASQWTFAARAIRKSALIVYPSAFLRDSWVARFTLLGCPAAVIPPDPVAPLTHDADRLALRREWGIDDGATVIMPMGEPVGAIDAHAAVFAAGVLGVAGHHAVVLVPPQAARLDRALRFASRIRPSRRVIVDDRPPFALLPGCDLALWFEPESESTGHSGSAYTTPLGAVSLAWADAMGIPIVAHDHPAWRSVVGESPRCVPVYGRTRHPLTRAILQAIEHASNEARAEQTRPTEWANRFDARVLSLLHERARTLAASR